MKNQWLASKTTLNGHKCLQHSVTKEYAMFGEHGEIYSKNSSTYKARVWNPGKVRIKPPEDYKWQKGDEAVFEFPATEINYYKKLLKVPNLVYGQVSCAIKSQGVLNGKV